MADLIVQILADDGLTEKRRRNVASAIRCFCAALHCEPVEVPANHWYFRERLRRFHPLGAGISKKNWQNIKSNVDFALRHAGHAKGQPRSFARLTAEWQMLYDRLPTRTLRMGLSRLARFCSAQGIRPQAVDDDVMEAYYRAVKQESFKIAPERYRRDVCRNWNGAVGTLLELALRPVSLPNGRDIYTPPWEALPATFRKEAEGWLEKLGTEPDLFSSEDRRALRLSSIRTYRYQLRQIVGALINRGIPIESIDTLNKLVEPAGVKTALQFFIDRNNGKPSSNAAGVANVLVRLASTDCRADDAAIANLRLYRKRLTVRPNGMAPLPRDALRQFVDRTNIEKILALPVRIYEQLKRKSRLTKKDARLMQVALALELLLMRPIRRRNLVDLRLDISIVRSGKKVFIAVPGSEVKNSVDLDYPIPAESVVLLDFYVARLLPLFGKNPERWLFPGDRPGRPKSYDQFTRQFTKVIREHTGLHFYPHLTRHFAAFLYLGENPGAFELMRRVLGHRSLATTTKSYASFDDGRALNLFDELVLRMRESIAKKVKDD